MYVYIIYIHTYIYILYIYQYIYILYIYGQKNRCGFGGVCMCEYALRHISMEYVTMCAYVDIVNLNE